LSGVSGLDGRTCGSAGEVAEMPATLDDMSKTIKHEPTADATRGFGVTVETASHLITDVRRPEPSTANG
jgi:hypothetical protein